MPILKWLIPFFLLASAASAQLMMTGYGPSGAGGGGSGCTMNGKFDLTNTCNDIYFIGGLK
jgi:hypothetical protein